MVGGPLGNPFKGEVPPPRLRQLRTGTLEAAKRGRAERHEDPRSDGLDLAPEVRPTRFDLVRLRRAVRGGSTLNHVRDEDVLPREPGGSEGPVEHRAGGPHERSAGRIFLPSRRFADQKHAGVDGAFPWDCPGPAPVQPTEGAFSDLGGDLVEDDRAFRRRAHEAGWPGAFIAFAGSLFLFRHPVREGLDLRLDPFDLSLKFRSDPFEFPFRLQAVHGVFLHRVLGSPDLRAVPRLDPPESFQFSFELVRGRNLRTPAPAHPNWRASVEGPLPGDDHVEDAIGIRVLQRAAVRVQRQVDDAEIGAVPVALEDELALVQAYPDALARDARHLRGEENRRFREDHVDQGIPRPDLLALQRGPRRLEPRLARAGCEAVDERFPENPQLALEGILEHPVKRPPGFLELVLNTHEGIFAFLPDRTAFRAIRPQPIEIEMRSRFHIVFERGRIIWGNSNTAHVTMSTVGCNDGRRSTGRRGRAGWRRGLGGDRGRNGRRGLRGPRRGPAGSDLGHPFDQHPVTRDPDELNPVVHKDGGTELQLVFREEGFATFGRDHLHLPIRMVLPESFRDLLDPTFLEVLDRREEGDRHHVVSRAYRSAAHKVCARVAGERPWGLHASRTACGSSWTRRETRPASTSGMSSSASPRGRRRNRSAASRHGACAT